MLHWLHGGCIGLHSTAQDLIFFWSLSVKWWWVCDGLKKQDRRTDRGRMHDLTVDEEYVLYIWSIRRTSFAVCYGLCVHLCERDHGWMAKLAGELCGCGSKNTMLFCLYVCVCVCSKCVLAGQPWLWLCWGSISRSTAPVIPSGEEQRGSVLNPLVLWLSGWSQYCQDEAVSCSEPCGLI